MTRPVRDVPGTTTGIDELTERQHHELLSADRRKAALEVLDGGTDSVALEELAAAVAAREGEGTGEGAVERVATTLHHVHLPKMDDAGVIDYDPEECLVVRGLTSPVSSV